MIRRMVASTPSSTVETGVISPRVTIAVSMRVAGCRQFAVTRAACERTRQVEGECGQRELRPAISVHPVVSVFELGIGGVDATWPSEPTLTILDGAEAVSSGTSSLVSSTGAR